MNPPYLKIVYDNGFGDKVSVKTTLQGNSLEYLVAAFKDALKGMGFGGVDEYFEEDNESKES
jgi:hypothetical protein